MESPPLGRTSLWIAVAALVGSVSACAEPGVGLDPAPRVDFATVTDSTGSPFVGTVSLAALVDEIVLPEPATLRVTILERNAAWWHRLSIVRPEIRVLAGPGYLFPETVGPFELGPYEAGSVLFVLDAYNPREPHEFYGTATARISGSFPSWTIGFEDGLDNDFDDIIVRVEAVVSDCPPEPYFSDPQFRNELAVLWDISFPDKPVADQRERLGWIVERDGGFEVDLVIVTSDACAIIGPQREMPPDAIGFVHTHPSRTGTIIQPGECAGYNVPTEMLSGPSAADIRNLESFERQLGRSLDGIILEPDRVWQFSSAVPAGTSYPACTYR